MKQQLALLILFCTACSSTPMSPDLPQADLAPAAPQVGDVEPFAILPARTEGIAFGKDSGGATVLYVGSAGALWRVLPDGTTSKVADVPDPVGIAVRADGDILVCGKDVVDRGPLSAVIWRVTPSGTRSLLVGQAGPGGFKLTNFVAVAPDDSLVFSDSADNKLYAAAGDGTGVRLVTDKISYPNGLAFSTDGKSLFVAAWDAKTVYQLAREAGGYGPPLPYTTDLAYVDGLTTLASGALVYVTSAGVARVADGKATWLLPKPMNLVPANGASGRGVYGEGWLYLSNLLNGELQRLYIGEPGAPLPAR